MGFSLHQSTSVYVSLRQSISVVTGDSVTLLMEYSSLKYRHFSNNTCICCKYQYRTSCNNTCIFCKYQYRTSCNNTCIFYKYQSRSSCNNTPSSSNNSRSYLHIIVCFCALEFQFLSVPTHSRLPSRQTRSTFYVPNTPSTLGYD